MEAPNAHAVAAAPSDAQLDAMMKTELDAQIDAMIKTELEKRAVAGEAMPNDNEIAKMRDDVYKLLNSEKMQNMAKQLSGIDGADFRAMAMLNGVPGAAALLKSIIVNCPELSNGRKQHLLRAVVYPDSIRPDDMGRTSGQKITINVNDGQRHFMLHTAEVAADHSIADELAVLRQLLKPDQIRQVEVTMTVMFQHIRNAYRHILATNQDILAELQPKIMKNIPEFDPTALYADDVRGLLHFEVGGKKWEPCASMRITEVYE